MHSDLLNSPMMAEDLQAEQLYAWEFQRSEDRNADQWPDGWRRRTGRNFPNYIPIRIVPRDAAFARAAREAEPMLSRFWMAYHSGKYFKQFIAESTPEPIANFIDRYAINNCLTIEMDGGAAELESPPFKLDQRFTYTMDASLSSQGLQGHSAWVELLLLDDRGSTVGSSKTISLTGTNDWRVLSTNSFSSESMRMGQVVLHIDRLKSSRLSGRCSIDEIRIYRMPKLELTVSAPHHVVAPNQPVEIRCAVLGVNDAHSTVNFKLLNHLGELIQNEVVPLVPLADSQSVNSSKKKAESSQRIDGIAQWQLSISDPDYYRVVVDLGRTSSHTESRQISREISLAVVADTRVGTGGPFGWTLPDFNTQITPEMIPELVKLAGVGWLKIPVWYHPNDQQSGDRLSMLLERLDLCKVTCVGLLDQPVPPDAATRKQLPVATVFSAPEDWEPLLEPALTRMSMKLSWFQLGRDNDRSFIGNPALVQLINDIRNRMQAYSQELQLAINWDYQDPLPSEKTLPWRANQMSCEPQLSARELKSYVNEAAKLGQTNWVALDPIPASRYSMLDRVRDLAERMIAVKQYKVEAAFVSAPLDRETGIFNADGTVGDLFLPWRLLNLHLASANYIGSVNLPGGSTNHIFEDGQSGFMLLWNDRDTVEQLYLGNEVQASDLWGKPLKIEQTKSDHNTLEQKLNVTSWPILLRGISIPVARWRMKFQLENKALSSIVSQRTELPFMVENTFGTSAFGKVTLVSPNLLQAGSANARLQLSTGQQQRTVLPLPVRSNASAGKHILRFDFELSSDQDYAFSVYDNLTLGIGDVELVWELIEINDQRAVLRVELVNNTDRPVSFDCKLFAPKQPYRRFQILDAAPGQTFREMVLPVSQIDANSKLYIGCEESATGRVLNYEVPLKPQN